MAAVIGAAAIAQARRAVIAHFVSQRAISPATAVAFDSERRVERRFFDRLREEGVIRAALAGYWIDEERLRIWQSSRRRRLGIVVGGLLAGAAAAIGIGLRS